MSPVSNGWKILVAAVALIPGAAFAGPVLMLGHVDDTTARIWAHSAEVADSPLAWQGDVAVTGRWDRLDDVHAVAVFDGLSPATDTRAVVDRRELVFRTAPPPALTGRVTFAVGSCNALFEPTIATPIFDSIAARQPDVMLWLGDNWYYLADGGEPTAQPKLRDELLVGEWTDPRRARSKALLVRLHPSLARLLGATSHVATWDDHDFGYNNCPAGDPPVLTPEQQRSIWFGRDAALGVFRSMWANPAYGTSEAPGTFFGFRRGPVSFFVLDNRYHKDVPAQRVWGRAQLDWLKAGLKAAQDDGVPVKVIAHGTQVLIASRKENLRNEAPGELEELLAWIDEHRITGVLFLSGDKHRTEFWRFPREGGELMELTASALWHPKLRDPEDPNPNRVWVGPKTASFSLVTVDIPAAGEGTLRIESLDPDGQPVPNIGGDSPSSCRTIVPLPAR